MRTIFLASSARRRSSPSGVRARRGGYDHDLGTITTPRPACRARPPRPSGNSVHAFGRSRPVAGRPTDCALLGALKVRPVHPRGDQADTHHLGHPSMTCARHTPFGEYDESPMAVVVGAAAGFLLIYISRRTFDCPAHIEAIIGQWPVPPRGHPGDSPGHAMLTPV